MSQFSNNANFPFLSGGAGGAQLVNKSLQFLDTLWAGGVEDIRNNAPGAPAAGAGYIIGTPDAGDTWDGEDGNLAIYVNNKWEYIEPTSGMRVWVRDTGEMWIHSGSAWAPLTGTFFARKSAGDQTINSTWVTVKHETVMQNDADAFTHDPAGSGTDYGRVQINYSGRYLIAWSFQGVISGTASTFEFGVSKSVGAPEAPSHRSLVSMAAGTYSFFVEVVLSLAAGGSVYLVAQRGAGTGSLVITDERSSWRIQALGI